MKYMQIIDRDVSLGRLGKTKFNWRKSMKAGAVLTVALLLSSQAAFAAGTADKDPLIGLNAGQQVQDVYFKNGAIRMDGDLYLPDGFDKNKKYAAIIVTHPGGGVKEQTAGLYAKKLASEGFVTLAFDASHQGDSGGEPRFLENPTERVEDIRSGVDYLSSLAFVSQDRIGALGICAGGGYTINAAMTEHRIKAVGTVSAVDIGLTTRKGWNGDVPVSEQLKLLDSVAKQRTAEANGAEPLYVNYVPQPDANTPRDLREAYEYYRTPRGQHPNSTNQMLFTSIDKMTAFSAFDQMGELLTQPLLLIAGSDAGSLWQSKQAYELANSKKELFVVKGATHMTLYDQPEHVDQAVKKLAPFFKQNI
ncbi:alpha/beta hydrolase [Pseudaeromonas pectinilytica]|nr:alpha/beta hydrolase [Aeromonadaceae bacterium]MBP8772877.1 alpha/beta hydrolase [Aeromonadaceae bacterium]